MRTGQYLPTWEGYKVRRNTAHSMLSDAINCTWFRVFHDIIPKRYGLHHIYQPTTVLAALYLIPCFTLVLCKRTEDVWKWTCERLALILGTVPQHVPPEWLRAHKFSFHPNPTTTLRYGSWTTRLITRSKPYSDHSHRLYGLGVEEPVDA